MLLFFFTRLAVGRAVVFELTLCHHKQGYLARKQGSVLVFYASVQLKFDKEVKYSMLMNTEEFTMQIVSLHLAIIPSYHPAIVHHPCLPCILVQQRNPPLFSDMYSYS